MALLLLTFLSCRYLSDLYTSFNDFKKVNLLVFSLCANVVCENTSLNQIKIALVKILFLSCVYLIHPNI